VRLTNSRLIPFLVLAASAALSVGCDQGGASTSAGPAAIVGSESGVNQDALMAAEINAFFAQDAVEVTLYPVERPEAIQGFIEVPLTHGRMQIEVLFHKETLTEQHLEAELRDGKREIAINLSDIGGFQGHSSLGDHVVDRTEVGEFLIDEEQPTLCGTRKTATVAVIEHDGDEIAVMLALHLLPLTGLPVQSDEGDHLTVMSGKISKVAGEPSSKSPGDVQNSGGIDATTATKQADPVPVQNTDCGDDWTFFGAPDCEKTCQRICTQVITQTDAGGVGGGKIGPAWCVVLAGGVKRCFARYQVKLNCQTDWGFFTNTCECSSCPSL
jgi:hypothetical protein